MNAAEQLNKLWEDARNEPATLGLEQVVQRFEVSSGATSPDMSSLSNWWMGNLAKVAYVLVGGGIVSLAVWSVTKVPEQIPEKQSTISVTIDSTAHTNKIMEVEIKGEGAETQPSVITQKIVDDPALDEQESEEVIEEEHFEPMEPLTELGGLDSDQITSINKAPEIDSSFVDLIKKELNLKQSSLSLSSNSTEEDVQLFEEEINKGGLKVEVDARFSRDSRLKSIKLYFEHTDGLDLKIGGEGFSVLDFKMSYDDNGEIEYFSYRFNKERFTRNIPLNITGYRTHKYGKNSSYFDGSTSINIAPEEKE